jgi:hypothetical protein
MANLGEITEIVNASELTLEVGADNYILLTNLNLHIGRTEDRIATTDGGALYTYGKGENFFTATLIVSTPELSSLNTLVLPDRLRRRHDSYLMEDSSKECSRSN